MALPEVNVGEKILMRRYKDILCEYKQLEGGNIGKYGFFHKEYEHLCGKEHTVTKKVLDRNNAGSFVAGFNIASALSWWFEKDLFDWFDNKS